MKGLTYDKATGKWGCSNCAWTFSPPDQIEGDSLHEMVRNFELRRDTEFATHDCRKNPKAVARSG